MTARDFTVFPSTHMDATFIQHPAEIPIGISCSPRIPPMHAGAVTVGGLAFASRHPHEPGTDLSLRFPTLDPQFVVCARVVWCDVADEGHRIGVMFFDTHDAFRLRMLEQIGAIRAHWQRAVQQGKQGQTSNDAAFDWIRNIAVGFPDP